MSSLILAAPAAAPTTSVNPMVWLLIGLVVVMAILIVMMRVGSHRRRRAQQGQVVSHSPAVIDEAPPSGEREIYSAQPRPLFPGADPSMGSALAPPPPPVESLPAHVAPAPIQAPGAGTTLRDPGVPLPAQADRFHTPGYDSGPDQQQFAPPPLSPVAAPSMATFNPAPAPPTPTLTPAAPGGYSQPPPFMPADSVAADAGWTTVPDADIAPLPAPSFAPQMPAPVAGSGAAAAPVAPPALVPTPAPAPRPTIAPQAAPTSPTAPSAAPRPSAPPPRPELAIAPPAPPRVRADPVAPEAPAPAPLAAAPVSVATNGAAHPAAEGRQTILLIEDDERIAKFYTILFEAKGFNVENARDGLEGVDMASSVRPSLILLDVMMPKMNGLMVLQTLRANPETEHTPVVVLSNYMEPPLIQRALQLGAIEYVVKSQARPEQLVNALPSWLKGEPALH